MVKMTNAPDTSPTRPKMVKNQPLPMPRRIGDVTMMPTQEKMFRMKLFSATPDEDRLGMNSVSMVVTMPKMSMEPMPKKKFAIIWRYYISVSFMWFFFFTYRYNPVDPLL